MLQRIVKALPYKLLLVQKDSRPFWCFVFLSRCLIYKVHAAVTAGFHCTTFSSLCQELFSFILSKLAVVPCRSRKRLYQGITFRTLCQELFSALFEVLSVFSPPPSQATRLGYHTRNSLSRTFFDLPVISFSTLCEFFVRFPLLAQGFDPSLKRLLILAEPPPIVNCFFRVFHSFFTFLRQPYIFGYFACSNHKMCGLFSCGFISCQKLPPG